jgi:hypothetical protein
MQQPTLSGGYRPQAKLLVCKHFKHLRPGRAYGLLSGAYERVLDGGDGMSVS